jgi:hypothetical protein
MATLACTHLDQICVTTLPSSNDHPIARSAEPGEDWSWCFVDEIAFVVDTSSRP